MMSCYLADQSHSAQVWLEWTLSGCSFVIMTTYNVALVIHPSISPPIPRLSVLFHTLFSSLLFISASSAICLLTKHPFFSNSEPTMLEISSHTVRNYVTSSIPSRTCPSTRIPSQLGSGQLHAFHTFICFASPSCAFVVL